MVERTRLIGQFHSLHRTGQTAKKKAPPEPLHLPALIYQTKRQMDDYKADDMYHGDLDTLIP